MGKLKSDVKNEDVGFQIAPMIDIIFLLILYFMVKVGDRQVEMEIRSKLPGSAEVSNSNALETMEETVTIDDAGVIAHNDEVLDAGAPTTHVDNKSRVARPDLAELKNRMKRLADQAKAAGPGAEVIVTVSPHPETPYYRLTDVLNTLQYASIKNMTISVQDEF
jgi:biopolymer transport protein ExbD